MSFQIVLIPNHDSRHFLLPLPELLNDAQEAFRFSLREQPDDQPYTGELVNAEVDATLEQIHSSKQRLGLGDQDLVIQFINKTLSSRPHGLTNLFLAGSSLNDCLHVLQQFLRCLYAITFSPRTPRTPCKDTRFTT
jgi:hypothetical protein